MNQMYKINGNPKQFADLGVFHKLSKQFLPYAQEKLGFDRPVGINLISDPQNAKNPLGKTAYYDPNKLEVTVFVDKRHVKDILRSMSHELVHHTQNCRGEFDGEINTGPGYAQEDGHMRKMEEEAYLEGQMLLRDFEDNLKKESKQMSRINESKMPMKQDTEDVDGDGQTDDQVPAFLNKGDVTKKKKTGKQPPQLAKAQGKDADSEKEEVDEGKGKPCPKCKKVHSEVKCGTHKRDDKKEKKGEKPKGGATVDTSGEMTIGDKPKSNPGTEVELEEGDNPEDQELKEEESEKTKKAREKVLKTTIAGKLGAGPNDPPPKKENWTRKNKDELLFERLVKKWCK